MDKIFDATDAFFTRAERRLGLPAVSALAGFLFLFAAAMITDIRFETFHHGNGFTRLSQHPFDFDNPNDLRFRILSPLLGYLLFFRGPAFKYFMLIVLALFLALIYFFRRRHSMRPSESLAITALCAFSTITFHQLYFPAYTDPLSFLLALLFLEYYRKPVVSTALLTLLLFNHENTVFLFPFFFFLCVAGNFSARHLLHVALRFLIAAIPYFAYRQYILSHVTIEYSVGYYFDAHNMQWTREHVVPHLLAGVFQSFRLFWIFPLAAIGRGLYLRKYDELILIFIALGGVLSQFLLAYDISRLAGMAFPVIILSAVSTRNFLGDKKFLRLASFIILLNFLVPSVYIGALEPVPLLPFWLK